MFVSELHLDEAHVKPEFGLQVGGIGATKGVDIQPGRESQLVEERVKLRRSAALSIIVPLSVGNRGEARWPPKRGSPTRAQ